MDAACGTFDIVEEYGFLKTPIGWLKILANGVGITSIEVLTEPPRTLMTLTLPHLKEAYRQLTEYFRGERLSFNLPLAPTGTDFQRNIWSALAEIPFGTTTSAVELAQRLGLPDAAGAIGIAKHSNPLPIVIPCHRVMSEESEGEARTSAEINHTLLKMEGALAQGEHAPRPKAY